VVVSETIFGMEEQQSSTKRVVAGGLFALFCALVIAALAVFGIISMTLGHVFMFSAGLVGALLIWTEVIPSKAVKHKLAWTMLLWGLMGVADFWIVKYKKAEALEAPKSNPLPNTSTPVAAPLEVHPVPSPDTPKQPLSPKHHHVAEGDKPPTPDVTLRFVSLESPLVVLVNSSPVVARNIKWGVVLWKWDAPAGSNPLQIPIASFDWIKSQGEGGPEDIFSRVASQLKSGDILYGSAFVDCPECPKGHSYFVHITYGRGGWFSEIMSDKAGGPYTPVNSTKEGMAAFFAAIDRVPQSERIPITPQ
jgi:hypothetical protein